MRRRPLPKKQEPRRQYVSGGAMSEVEEARRASASRYERTQSPPREKKYELTHDMRDGIVEILTAANVEHLRDFLISYNAIEDNTI